MILIIALLALIGLSFALTRKESIVEGLRTFAGQQFNPLLGSPWESFSPSQEVTRNVREHAKATSLRDELVAAIIMTESSFRVNAVNSSDPSYGLMGVTPLIAKAFGGWEPATGQERIKDVDINLAAGTGFMRHLMTRYGKLEDAIQAYNLGETKFDRGIRVPAYLARVTDWFNRFGGFTF